MGEPRRRLEKGDGSGKGSNEEGGACGDGRCTASGGSVLDSVGRSVIIGDRTAVGVGVGVGGRSIG